MIREFVTTIDSATRTGLLGGGRTGQPLEVGYFRTQHIPAKVADEALQAVLSKEGRVGVMEKEDRLVISDHAENLAMVKTVLERIDRPRPQVRITALIYDISLQDIEQLGINWNQTGKARIDAAGDPQTSFGIDSIMQVPFESGTAGSALTFMNLSRHLDITAVVLALNNANDARLLANPSVLVQENEEAVFQSVSEIPYQQLTETSAGGQIGTTAFKEAGITLRVIPKIAIDGTIRMVVSPEFSRLTGFTPGDNQPIIDKRVATTTLGVANRQTIVIGGLRQRSDVGDFKGVPYLMDMRGIGKLFRSRDTNVRESELVLFISPEVVSPADPVDYREQMIIDTIGCRLNQIPVAEGCPPPPCVYPSIGEYAVAADPVRLPAVESVAERASTDAESTSTSATKDNGTDMPLVVVNKPADLAPLPQQSAIAPPRRLPKVDQILPAPDTMQTGNLFDAPPPPGFEMQRPSNLEFHVGGSVEFGGGTRALSR
jgi:general secretion pathway protein D